jgi:hypothetical protein
MEIDLRQRFQTMLTLWFALMMSVVMYFVVSVVTSSPPANPPGNQSNTLLVLGCFVLGALCVAISWVVKKKFLDRSVANQDVGLVQRGMIIACAMCEVSALLGLLGHFLAGNREFYFLFLLAAFGMALHFPRRSQLEAATYKAKNVWN